MPRNNIAPNVAHRNGFKLLGKRWHISYDDEGQEGNRLHEVANLVDMIVERF